MRTNYWSCSKLADLIRGTESLHHGGTSEEFSAWKKVAYMSHPYRFWIAEEFLDKIQDVVYWPTDSLYSLKYYLKNRYITRTNSLTASPDQIKPGHWSDVGNRFLPCMFNELVDFVEIELANDNIRWDEEARHKYNVPFHAIGWFNLFEWRSKEAGLDKIAWSKSLIYNEEYGVNPDDEHYNRPTTQSIGAKEIEELYLWWTTVYPNRIDPMDESGLTAYYDLTDPDGDKFMSSLNNRSSEDSKLWTKIHARCDAIEAMHIAEDEEMMIRLIKIRDHLWT